MARRRNGNGRSRAEWEELGKEALLDLLSEKFVVPWAEAEARISVKGWKNFDTVQPIQLSGARRSLRQEGRIEEEVSAQNPPVHLVRLAYPDEGRRSLERLVGQRRKGYRKYLSWAGDQSLCGRHAERVVLDSLRAAALDADLYVPKQSTGAVGEIKGVRVAPGPLDALAHVMERESATEAAVVAFEVKNINTWIYPRAVELWSLLVKAAPLAAEFPIVPVCACVRYGYEAQRMGSDLGFFVCAMRDQVFSPRIDPDEFDTVIDDFGLVAIRHEGALEPVVSFLTGTLRRSPPLSEPRGEKIEWFLRQAERFRVIAPVILNHAALAEDLDPETRRKVFISFATNAVKACSWPLTRGWS